jgi:histidinol-phosphate phosphatase family protein
MKPALRPALFFDRDGIVNRSPGPGYVNHLDDFHILPGFADCVRAAAARGLPALIVTNQRGISRGLTPPEQLAAMHRRLRDELAREGLELLDLLVCTADDSAHPDRKPNPGMLLQAAGTPRPRPGAVLDDRRPRIRRADRPKRRRGRHRARGPRRGPHRRHLPRPRHARLRRTAARAESFNRRKQPPDSSASADPTLMV